jgi:hypothetical protein
MNTEFQHILAPALRKLEKRVSFSVEDRLAFQSMPFSLKELNSGTYIVRERDNIKNCCIPPFRLRFQKQDRWQWGASDSLNTCSR